jgi:CrcB protein
VIALAVIAAGAVGALVRYLVSRAFAAARLPWAVLVVNVAGSALGGAVLGLVTRAELSADLRLVVLTGLCGGLTTFSTLSVETVQLVLEGRPRAAVSSIVANLVLGIGAAALACCLALLP